jgi:hypothetical protein
MAWCVMWKLLESRWRKEELMVDRACAVCVPNWDC